MVELRFRVLADQISSDLTSLINLCNEPLYDGKDIDKVKTSNLLSLKSVWTLHALQRFDDRFTNFTT